MRDTEPVISDIRLSIQKLLSAFGLGRSNFEIRSLTLGVCRLRLEHPDITEIGFPDRCFDEARTLKPVERPVNRLPQELPGWLRNPASAVKSVQRTDGGHVEHRQQCQNEQCGGTRAPNVRAILRIFHLAVLRLLARTGEPILTTRPVCGEITYCHLR
jgi:hypothetical protein